MLHTTANDIISMDFDWLMLPTTTNDVIGIKKPNFYKILIFPPSPLKSLRRARIDELAGSKGASKNIFACTWCCCSCSCRWRCGCRRRRCCCNWTSRCCLHRCFFNMIEKIIQFYRTRSVQKTNCMWGWRTHFKAKSFKIKFGESVFVLLNRSNSIEIKKSQRSKFGHKENEIPQDALLRQMVRSSLK